MALIANVVVALVALLHLYILVLEMFLWDTPRGRRAFNLTPELAAATRAPARPRRQPGALQRIPRRRPAVGPRAGAGRVRGEDLLPRVRPGRGRRRGGPRAP